MKFAEYLIILLVCMALFSSCKKELDFEYRDIEPILVVEAQADGTEARAMLTLTTPMDEPMDRRPITDAAVVLTDLATGNSSELVADADGRYRCDFEAGVGHVCRMSVSRGGKTYTSESVMTEAPEIKALEFNWVKMPYDYVAALRITFTDDSTTAGDRYWVRLYRNGEAYMWAVVNDGAASDGEIVQVFMTSRQDLSKEDDATALRKGDVVTASAVAVSTAMGDYLTAVSNNSNGPAMWSGDFCLGYFVAAEVAESSLTFDPDEIPYY